MHERMRMMLRDTAYEKAAKSLARNRQSNHANIAKAATYNAITSQYPSGVRLRV
jgi:hypothetical protein